MQVVVDSLLIHYTESGSGKVILLLHGWADRLETFVSLQPALTEKYKVVALDLPGFGQSQAPHEAWDLDNYADVLRKFLIKTGSPKVYAIIGHSNGGALAIRALATEKISADKLILLAASGVRNTRGIRRNVVKAVAKTGKAATIWLPRATRFKLQKALYGSVGSDILLAPELKETFKQTVRQDIQVDASKLTLPTLLVYGDRDKATPLSSVGKRLERLIRGSRLEVIVGADHFVHQTKTAEVEKLIESFLA